MASFHLRGPAMDQIIQTKSGILGRVCRGGITGLGLCCPTAETAGGSHTEDVLRRTVHGTVVFSIEVDLFLYEVGPPVRRPRAPEIWPPHQRKSPGSGFF
jgi:hypothetical protein